MLSTFKLQVSKPGIVSNCDQHFAGIRASRRLVSLRPARRRFASLCMQYDEASLSEPSDSTHFTATVGSPPSPLQFSHWNLAHRHAQALNFVACAAAVSATCFFFSAIPTLLALKRAAESLEKLLDVTREELPDTMAALRLSGMEISDLTMELSDLGQEINQGVRSSTRAVRLAEERLRWLTNMVPSAMVQEVGQMKTKAASPVLARTARGMREGIVKGRAMFQIFFILTRFSRMAIKYFTSRRKS